MAQAWPVGVPTDVLEDGYSEAWADNTIRSAMDVGPPKVRRRSTAAVRRMAAAQILTTAQAATMQTFYETTCAYGSLSFNMTDPRTGSTIEARFVSPPAITPIGNGRWRAGYDIEVLP